MSYKQKRLITHKELEKAVMKAGAVDVSVYGIVAMVLYPKGQDAYKTGKGYVGFTPLGTFVKGEFSDGESKLDDKNAIAYEVNFGEWLEKAIPTLLGERGLFKGNKNNVELEVNRAWKGFKFCGNRPALTVGQRTGLLKEFYGTVNKEGTVKLINANTSGKIERLRQRVKFSNNKGSLGRKFSDFLEQMNDEDAKLNLEIQLREWVNKYGVNTRISADPDKLIKYLFKLHHQPATQIANDFSSKRSKYDGKQAYILLTLDDKGLSGDKHDFEDYSWELFNEEAFLFDDVALVFDTGNGWEEEMVDAFNEYAKRQGFKLGVVRW